MSDTTFEQRLELIEERIAGACEKAGRSRDELNLLAVSKTHGPEAVREAAECGLVHFGENKVQEAAAKIPLCPSGLTWHLIGHLQRNKVKRAVPLFSMIHSIDSERLMLTVEEAAAYAGRNLPVLLEINVSGEGSKFGCPPEDLPALLECATTCMHLDVTGLMTMPPWSEYPEKARTYFAALRELKEQCNDQHGFPMDELSMGMSHDFEVAIEEGATWIRVGTALFGKREKK